MARKKKIKNKKKPAKEKKLSRFSLPDEVKRVIWGAVSFLAAVIIILSFFELAGEGGKFFIRGFTFLFGKAVFFLPLFLVLTGLAFFSLREKNKWPVILAAFLLTLGVSGIFEGLGNSPRQGGWVGYLATWPLLKAFGFWATHIIFGALVITGAVILWQFLYRPSQKGKEIKIKTIGKERSPLIKRIFGPKFKVKSIEPPLVPEIGKTSSIPEVKTSPLDLKTKPLESIAKRDYRLPPIDLLESDKGIPTTGDIRINSAIIKRTLQNFGIQVEMSEVNIGPTVTQYTLKPAEGVKLSKITTLGNDLALALASHPIRIEAPIPGKPLVGIEIPNRARTTVRLRNLIEHRNFQNSISNLTLVLGRDVSGKAVFADLARMPHLLVAGSTGTGKTICLNSIILSLLYQNSPEILQFILIDPKRVEFPVYNDLPHLLTPVIYDAQKAVNSLKWLIGEMERRFEVLSQGRSRDITGYNEKMVSEGSEPMPYIVLIVDELADLMAARGREIEAGIVRLAQMARAVGIHLVVATQRPSVEVITGLIKANITSRITFQVASQVDSRTVLDMAGAEKLLGLGDMLFISAEISKPKRIQGAYVADREVKKVVKYIKAGEKDFKKPEELVTNLSESIEKTLEGETPADFWGEGEDPLLAEAKKVVIEAKKASASLLQRRLRVGYARAARLIDMLEERGVVGPGEGAKPREILIPTGEESEDGWKKV
jgi:S-DNA-T family DNA segregation ATPase FtsK/SpoIIIE